MLKTPTQFSVTTTIFAGFLFLSSPVPALASSDCGNLKGCERKFCEIETQLNTAQEKGNKHEAGGLQKALESAKEHCTDERLREELVEDIEDAKEDIIEYKADLKEAEEDGKADKVRKYQGKIEEENSKIKRFENELSHFD